MLKETFVECRLNVVRCHIQAAGQHLSPGHITELCNSSYLLDKAPYPAKLARIGDLLSLVDYIGQVEPRRRTINDLILALRSICAISAAVCLEEEISCTPKTESPEAETGSSESPEAETQF